MGVPWRDAPTIGNLLGTRMALNEFVAYSQLGPLKATLDPKSFTIATFALCGFANFSSIGIQIGGIGALAPEPPPRSGAPRPARDARRHAGELHDGDDRRIPALNMAVLRRAVASTRLNAVRARRAGDGAVDRDRARVRARRLRRARSAAPCRMPYDELPHWPASRVVGHDGQAGRRHVPGHARSRRSPAAATSTKGTTCATVTFAVARAGPARRQDADPDQRRRRHQHRRSRRAR